MGLPSTRFGFLGRRSMRDFLIMRLAAFSGAVLGAGLLLVVLLDLLPAGTLFNPAAWANALTLATSPRSLAAPRHHPAARPPRSAGRRARPRPRCCSHPHPRSPHRCGRRHPRRHPALLARLLLLALGVGGMLRWLPASGFVPWDNPSAALASLILPAIALGLPQAGAIATRTRDLLAPTRHPDADPRDAGPTPPRPCRASSAPASSPC